MVDSYSGNLLPTRAIYPSRYAHYIALLCGIKFLRAFGIFLTYDLLKLIHVVQLLFFIKAGSAFFLVFLQKPFSSGKRISKHQWFRIVRHAFLGTLIGLLWLFGLTLCGPLRTLLLFEHSDVVIIAGASALFTNSSTPSKFRGGVFFIFAVIGILLFDHDDHIMHDQENPEVHRESHKGILAHLFEHFSNLTGLNDHKGGVVLLFFTLCLHVGFHSAAKKLSVDVGGAKRLHALSTLVSGLMLLPWTVFSFSTAESLITSWWSMIIPLVLVILLVSVVDYYVEAACVSKLELSRTSCYGAFAIFTSAMVLSAFWDHPFVTKVTTMQHLKGIIAEDHVLSGGVVFSYVLFMFSTNILTKQNRAGNKGSFIGYSPGGLPLYNFTGERLQKTSHSVSLALKNGLSQILAESDSRKIFFFLCINLMFTFVELIYGVWTNSLGLISDGFHMLFDCSALVMGLYAAVMARWKSTRIFSYGYDRVEILSGFINALFLIVISFFVFTAAVTRIVDPPDIKTERLLVVSIAGLLVNLIGICAFQHGHSHGGGGHGHSHGGGHGHSHGGSGGGHGHSHGSGGHGHSNSGGHGHSHGSPGHGHGEMTHNTNMQGVFLHVLADTLGSVGVIISTILIENLGWKVADPICSLFIATLIFVSVLPLVKETAMILLLRTPLELENDLTHALKELVHIDGVQGYRDEHFWRHSSKVICGTIHIQARPDASEQKLTTQVSSLLKEAGVTNLTIQFEKEAYFAHMQGLGVEFQDIYESNKNRGLLTYNSHNHSKGM